MDKKVKKDYLWNMIGSVCYSASSVYYLMMVTRVCGVIDGGIFALAFSTAQLLLTFGRYGMRTYQATDMKKQYSFLEYCLTRLITCIGMICFAIAFSGLAGYSSTKFQVFVWVAALKMVDAIEDVFHGELQRNNHVDVMGKMLALRNIFSCVIFGASIIYSKNLLFACMVSVISSVIIALIINMNAVIKNCSNNWNWTGIHLIELFSICFPIFISTFLSLYLYNIPKYAIDKYMTEDIQTYYSILFMPSFIISLFSEIITKPMLTTIAISWEKDIEKFTSIIKKIFILIVAGTILVVLGGHFIGRWMLEIIYAVSLEPYKLHFIVLLIGGGISAAVYISYNILISIRFQKSIIVVYLIVTAIATPMTYYVVSKIGMMGAAVSYLLTCFMLEVIFLAILLWQINKKRRSEK